MPGLIKYVNLSAIMQKFKKLTDSELDLKIYTNLFP